MKVNGSGSSPGSGSPREPGSWEESLMYVAIILLALGCLWIFASFVTACDEASGSWQEALITGIDHETGQCSYDWGWGLGSAACPPNADRGEPARVYVTIDSSSGSNLVTLNPGSPWRNAAPHFAASSAPCLIGVATWVPAGRIQAREGPAPP
jgi:hypothetical protein